MKTFAMFGNAGLVVFAICVCFVGVSLGQSFIPVDSQQVLNLGIRDAKLVSVWIPKVDEQSNAEIKEKETRFVFSAPRADLNLGIILTAFAGDGSTIGQSVWCSRTVNANLSTVLETPSRSSKEATFSLTVNPNLLNAAKYSMWVIPPVSNLEPGPGPETCAECATTANAVCGSRGIKSMTCGGTTGVCTFVCNDR